MYFNFRDSNQNFENSNKNEEDIQTEDNSSKEIQKNKDLSSKNFEDSSNKNDTNIKTFQISKPDIEATKRSSTYYDKLGRLILSIIILEMEPGEYTLRLIPKITKPKLPIKQLRTTIYPTKKLRTKIIQSTKVGKVIHSRTNEVQDTMLIVSIIQSVFQFMGSFSSALKVGLTIKMVKVLKFINVKFGQIVDAFFQEFTRTVVEKERDDMALLARKFNGKLTEMGV